jgi:O-antigen ligase
MGRKLHFLLAPLIALAIFQIDFSLKELLLSLKLGLIVIGIIAIIGPLLGNSISMINTNILGDITVAMIFLSIVQIFIETPKERSITFIAVLAGCYTIYLTGARGSWLSFLILSAVFISLIYQPFLQNNKKRKIFLALLLVILFGLIGTSNNIESRVKLAVIEVQKWNSGHDLNDSVGLRMQMWKAGLSAAKEAPLLGYGYRNANKVASKYASKNKRTISNKTHLHNEYITNLVSAGVIGLLMLLILLFKPMIVFYQQLKNKDAYYYSMMGILLCIGYVTFGFTHVAFGEEHVNAFYVLFMALLLPKVISLKRL